jgi:hypothetical protein
MKQDEGFEQGQKLLTAVERILDDSENLIALGDRYLASAKAKGLDGEMARSAAAQEAVRHFSNLSALSGGAASLPALFPGIGSIVAMTGGSLADMGLVLKFEVEMALVLTHLRGFDIRRSEERQLAFLLASVSTYDAKSGRNFFVDVAEAESVALWNYAPRQVSKLLLSVLARLALLQVSKSLVRAVPLVGIAVGSSVNKVLTRKVGLRCIAQLEQRGAPAESGERDEDEVVEAKVKRKAKAS